MAFPTIFGLARAFTSAQTEAVALKAQVTTDRDAMAAGNVSADLVLALFDRLVEAKAVFDAVAATSGIVQYAKDQFDNPTLDIVAEFTAMSAAVDAAGTAIFNDFPKDGNNWLLAEKLTASGRTQRSFTSVETAAMRTALDTLIATIG